MTNKNNIDSKQLLAENEGLRAQLDEAEETLRAIRSGEVDALFVAGAGEGHLFTLKGADKIYRTLIEDMSEGALTMTAEGVILYANRRFAEMLKMPLEKVIGTTLHTWIAPDSQRFFQLLLSKGADEKRREQLVLTAGDGTLVAVSISVSNLLVEGMPDSYCLVATDLTEQKHIEAIVASEKLARELLAAAKQSHRELLSVIEDEKQTEEFLLKSKKEWEATFDSISDPLFIHDKEMRLVRVNRAYLSASGEAKFKNIIGRPYYEVFPKMDGPFKMCLKAQELQEEEEEEEEFLCPLTNRIFKVKFYPIKDVNGGYLYSIHILEDITEAKRSEERIKQEMEITSHLLMISEATADMTDIDKLMKQVVHCSMEVLGCDICLAYLWNNEERLFMPVHAIELPPHLIPIFMTEPIKEKDFLKGINQTFKEIFSWSRELTVGNVISVPLTARNEYLGLIIGIFSNKVELSDRHMKVVNGISRQVGVALEEAKLYRESVEKTMELSHRIETIQAMHEIDRSILSTLEPQEILETAVRQVGKVAGCDRATVVLVDKEREEFTLAAGFGLNVLSKGTIIRFEDSNLTDVLRTGRTIYISNLMEIGEPPVFEKKVALDGFICQLRIPLIVKEEVVGILTVGSKRPAAFTPQDLSALEKIASQIGVALQNARQLKDLEELFLGTVKSLSSAIDAKSPWTAGHSERVTKYALGIGKVMGFSEKNLKDLELAGLLHDVGKIGTYESILDKPGKLTDEEQAVIRLHPVKGAEILAPIKQLKDIIPGVKYHHEFFDGTGYPEGLKGEAIHLHARILTVADTVDAMGANRPYREGRGMDVIIAELKRCSGTQFDPKVVEAFLKIAGEGLKTAMS